MLQAFGRRMFKFVKACLDIFGHGDVACACGIVPVNGEFLEEGTGPADGGGIQFLEGLDEVVGVFLGDVLDPQVINDEGKMMGLVVCFQSSGVLGTGANPKWAR